MFNDYLNHLKAVHMNKQAVTEQYSVIRRFLKAPKDGRLLDIGTGSDELLQKLSDKGLDLYGVDISAADRERSIDEIALMGLTSIEELPYHGGFFDCVTTLHTPKLWEDKKKAFSEILRVLKPGGQLLCVFTFDSASGVGTPPRNFRAQAREAGFTDVTVKVMRTEGAYLLIGEKPC